MNKRTVIAELNNVANELDKEGFFTEASAITGVMKKVSQLQSQSNIPVDNPNQQMLSRRTDTGQVSVKKALDAQNFVNANSSNPKLKTQREWFNAALQISGNDQNFANNVISVVKASQPTNITNPQVDPRQQMLSQREKSGQLSVKQALDVQNFVNSNSSNPRLKTQRDWFDLALQASGNDQNFANNVISVLKLNPK